jgi:extracellular elastinolytic metalloproteinase
MEGKTASRARARWLSLLGSLLAVALLAPATGTSARGIHHNFDTRKGDVAASGRQRALVSELGARATWNRYGTPSSLVKKRGFLARGLEGGSAASVARGWLEAHSTLVGLSSHAGLELVNDSRLAGSDGHAVLFRQTFDGLDALEDGTIVVGVTGSVERGWNVAYVSSSLTTATNVLGEPQMSAREAWARAAANVGRGISILRTNKAKVLDGRSLFAVDGFAHLQQARLGAMPTARGVIPAYETYFVEGTAAPSAYKHVIDARNGTVLLRENLVHQAQPPQTFTGSAGSTDADCGPLHGPYVAPPNTVSIEVVASADVPANDIVLKLYYGTTVVQSADTLTSPEAIHYEPAGGVPPGNYFVEVCEFEDGADPAVAPLTYSGSIIINDTAGGTIPYPPKWKVFPAHPTPSALTQDPWNNSSADIRKVWCWDSNVNGNPIAGCDEEVGNLASRVPWDVNARTGASTFKTEGNNARSAESWFSPLTPGATGFQPTSPQRNYDFPWANDWYTRDCNPNNFVTGVGYDIAAATTNLFAMHNRMHDWSYHLGFTEENWNAQEYNFGLTSATRENDSVLGDAQAGAANGGAPSYTGRDNANMVSLPEGTRPITNMYLWQPLAGSFYAPCVDGDYDMAVIGHEYGHLIENRMIGKGGTRSGHHAGAMGESNGDLNGMEILNEYGYVPVSDENPYAVGVYATGNKDRAIRNYGMNFPRTGAFPTPGVSLVRRGGPLANPLNFSDLGYDLTGSQVHADGEIWSATNFDIRQALVDKYGAGTPQQQRACAEGQVAADACPGNRRWIQLVYDAYLLMPVAPTMLQARDAFLAADQLRFGGANQSEIWLAFARRGFGDGAFSTNGLSDQNDTDPKPDFASPLHSNATITFQAVGADEANAAIANARVYVGHYEARVSPIADTNPATNATGTGANNLDAVASFAPGTYEFVANAPGYGHVRFRETFAAGETRTVTISMATNRASQAKGATASGDGVRHTDLIDDTEGTNWERTGANAQGSQVTVDLQGTDVLQVSRVQVSGMLLPGQNRFTALRQFAIEVSTNGNTFTRVFTSTPTAFPGVAPRPVAPELILRSFDLPSTVNAKYVRIVVLENQCTGQTAFQGEQDADPANGTDCRLGSPGQAVPPFELPTPQVLTDRDDEVRIAELQVFGPAAPPPPPATQPDLTVTDITSSNRGNRSTVSAIVRNIGTAAAGASKTEFLFDGTVAVCLVDTPGIAAGAQTTVSCRFDAQRFRGERAVTATADKAAQVTESNEANNSRTETFRFGD